MPLRPGGVVEGCVWLIGGVETPDWRLVVGREVLGHRADGGRAGGREGVYIAEAGVDDWDVGYRLWMK